MPKLFLLKSNFADEQLGIKNQAYFCPDCALIEGVLSYFPDVRQKLEIFHVDFPRPRTALIPFTGEAEQGCPSLILTHEELGSYQSDDVKQNGDWYFINDPKGITRFFAYKYGISLPH